MNILLYITAFFAFLILILSVILVLRIISFASENASIKEYLKVAINKINQARYGNFQIKFNEEKDDFGLYKSLNTLFESIVDRDLVINEYKEIEKENYNLKEEFIAALTHDLKVPIIAQDKTFDLFLNNKFGSLDSIQRDVILKLKESNSDLKEMVNSILETYKIENKGVQLELEKDIDVVDFVKSCVDGFSSVAENSGKKIVYHPYRETFYAEFDRFLIKRTLNNLIINAISHSKTTEKVDIHLNKTGDTFSIDVIDYGEGIDETEIKKIFSKYYSITGKTTRISSGLGLYLSNKIIKKHKGVIEVESKKNEGSIFRIILPLSQSFSINKEKAV